MTAYILTAKCPVCNSPLFVRYRRRDRAPFIGCSVYPECAFTAPFDDVIQQLGTRMAEPRGHADVDALAAQVETACRRLMQIIHPDKLTAHQAEAHSAAQIILDLRREVKGLTPSPT